MSTVGHDKTLSRGKRAGSRAGSLPCSSLAGPRYIRTSSPGTCRSMSRRWVQAVSVQDRCKVAPRLSTPVGMAGRRVAPTSRLGSAAGGCPTRAPRREPARRPGSSIPRAWVAPARGSDGDHDPGEFPVLRAARAGVQLDRTRSAECRHVILVKGLPGRLHGRRWRGLVPEGPDACTPGWSRGERDGHPPPGPEAVRAPGPAQLHRPGGSRPVAADVLQEQPTVASGRSSACADGKYRGTGKLEGARRPLRPVVRDGAAFPINPSPALRWHPAPRGSRGGLPNGVWTVGKPGRGAKWGSTGRLGRSGVAADSSGDPQASWCAGRACSAGGAERRARPGRRLAPSRGG